MSIKSMSDNTQHGRERKNHRLELWVFMFSSLMDSPRQYQHPELEIGKSGETACPRANRLIAPSSVMRISTSQMSAYSVANLLRPVVMEGH